MRLVLVSDHYPPMRTSAAIQMSDLAKEFFRQGHQPIVITPSTKINCAWETESMDGVQVLRLAAVGKCDGASYFQRTIYELLLPFMMMRNLRKSPFIKTQWESVIWYSPTIFFGPLIWYLKRTSDCNTYLILRDIFPEWAYDLGLIRKGIIYAFF